MGSACKRFGPARELKIKHRTTFGFRFVFLALDVARSSRDMRGCIFGRTAQGGEVARMTGIVNIHTVGIDHDYFAQK